MASMNGCVADTSASRYVNTSSSDSVARAATMSPTRFRLAGSAHCMSSRNSTSGCSRLQNTCTKFRNARLRADDQLELRHDVHDQLCVGFERLANPLAPPRDLFLAFRQQLLHEIAQCAYERTERDVLLELLELARHEVPAPAGDRLIDLLHERRLADAGLPRDRNRL